MPSVAKTTLQVLTGIALLLTVFALETAAVSRQAEVLVDHLNMRAAPDTGSPVLNVLSRGDRVDVIDASGDWLKISRNGQEGYIYNEADYVAFSPPAQPNPEADPSDASIGELREKAAGIQKEIEERKAVVERFTQEEAETIQSLDRLGRKINTRKMAVRKLRKDMAVIERAIAEQSAALKALEKKIRNKQKIVGRRLVALYKLNRVGPLHVLASAESIQEMLTRRNALERILESDEKQRQDLVRDLLQVQAITMELGNRINEKTALESSLKDRLARLDAERKTRNRLLKQVRSQKTLELAAITDLKSSAEALNRIVESLQRSSRTRKSLDTEFVLLKGLLEMPVEGKIINFYGPYRNTRFNVTNFRSGIDIQTDRGEPIRAVAPGNILFADWFKGYGNMIILDHGDNYYTLYAHIEELFKTKGDRVERGEVIATVGDSASLTGPGLYFEVRHHGKPENPMQWLKQG